MQAPLRRLGNSRGVILPKTVLARLGVGPDDCLDMSVEQNRIVLTRPPACGVARSGWRRSTRRWDPKLRRRAHA